MEKTMATKSKKQPPSFIKVPLWLMGVDISSSAQLLWGRLQLYQGKNSEGYARRSTLSKELHFSLTYITQLLKELKRVGLIQILSLRGQKLRFKVTESSKQLLTTLPLKSSKQKLTRAVNNRLPEQSTTVNYRSKHMLTTFSGKYRSKSNGHKKLQAKTPKGKEALKEVLKEARKEDTKTSSSFIKGVTPLDPQKQKPFVEAKLSTKLQGMKEALNYNGPSKCPLCGKPVVQKTNSKDGSKFHGCLGYPNCKWTYESKPGNIRAIEASDWFPEWAAGIPGGQSVSKEPGQPEEIEPKEHEQPITGEVKEMEMEVVTVYVNPERPGLEFNEAEFEKMKKEITEEGDPERLKLLEEFKPTKMSIPKPRHIVLNKGRTGAQGPTGAQGAQGGNYNGAQEEN